MDKGLFIETGYISLIKAGEQLCGDRVVFTGDDGVRICVLADGLGSGVQANILATLTAQILATMSAGGMPVEECVRTVVSTLPVSRVRKVAYSTFTIVKIRDDRYVELIRFDNPHTIVLRRGENYPFEYKSRLIAGKKIYESRFEVEEGDVFVVISDGVIHAGLGGAYPFGWSRENAIRFLEMRYDPSKTAQQIAGTLAEKCSELYGGKPGDDTTIAVMKVRRPFIVHLMIGPPSSNALDGAICEAFFAAADAHIVCGGTTNRIAASYLDQPLEASLDYAGSDLPPMYALKGVDLATEGALTISRVLDYAAEYLSGTKLHYQWESKGDGASHIARMLFDQATDIRFFVGCAMNPAHQNPKLSLAFGAKFQLIDKLSKSLEQMGKRVDVSYF
ncbi:MAG: SpoIIE family protein phosphatase [Clostridia bacterium]|nr:SpoIIE family protein phosphatase [Clostridia bacterium]